MKLPAILTAGALAIAGMTVGTGADAAVVVTKVHGPLKILPHHNRKICRIHWVHHRRVKKCWYH